MRLSGVGTNGAVLMWRVLAVLVIMAMLANWTWVLLAPRSASVLPATSSATVFQAEQLFGHAAASAVVVQAVIPNVRLVGVFAGKPGFAVLEFDGKRQVSVASGKEVEAGARLVEVAKDHVVIERNGVRQQIQLEGNASAINTAAAVRMQHEKTQ